MAIKDGKFIDKKSIKELVEILDEMKLSALSYQKGDVSISVSRGALAPVEKATNNDETINKTKELDYKNDPRVVKVAHGGNCISATRARCKAIC
jgi:hypothetical protein